MGHYHSGVLSPYPSGQIGSYEESLHFCSPRVPLDLYQCCLLQFLFHSVIASREMLLAQKAPFTHETGATLSPFVYMCCCLPSETTKWMPVNTIEEGESNCFLFRFVFSVYAVYCCYFVAHTQSSLPYMVARSAHKEGGNGQAPVCCELAAL